MEAIGAAANIIAVIDLSAKVATLCLQYYTEVAGAQADITRLQSQINHQCVAFRGALSSYWKRKLASHLLLHANW